MSILLATIWDAFAIIGLFTVTIAGISGGILIAMLWQCPPQDQ